jgi:hypothetical protein
MNPQSKNIGDEILSLASSIKKNMMDPPGQRIQELELRISGAERSIKLLFRAFWAAGAVLAAAMGTICYLVK